MVSSLRPSFRRRVLARLLLLAATLALAAYLLVNTSYYATAALVCVTIPFQVWLFRTGSRAGRRCVVRASGLD